MYKILNDLSAPQLSNSIVKLNDTNINYNLRNIETDLALPNLVPRSLVDEAEGEIWPNPICITWSPVRNVTGEASAHAQHKFGAVKAKVSAKVAKADFVAYIEDITR